MLPKKGRKLHQGGSDGADGSGFEQLIAAALRAELDSNRQTIKTVMRWTGASERTVKNWLAGTHGPSGEHLVGLTRYSDEVFRAFLAMADRGSIVLTADLAALRLKLLDVVNHIDGSAQSAGRQ